jgi:hypothetical protein
MRSPVCSGSYAPTAPLAERELSPQVASLDFKWLRLLAGGHATTGFHVDHVFFHENNHESGQRGMLTAWLPWVDTPVSLGGLAVLAGSSSLPGFSRVRSPCPRAARRAERVPSNRNPNFTGLAQIMGQLEDSNRDFQSTAEPTCKFWANPVNFSSWDALQVRATYGAHDVSHTDIANAGQHSDDPRALRAYDPRARWCARPTPRTPPPRGARRCQRAVSRPYVVRGVVFCLVPGRPRGRERSAGLIVARRCTG